MKIVVKESHDDKQGVTILRAFGWRDEDDGDLDPFARQTEVISDILYREGVFDVVSWEKERLMRRMFYEVQKDKERPRPLLEEMPPRG